MCSSNNLYHPDNLAVTGKGSVSDTEPVTVGLHIARALRMASTGGNRDRSGRSDEADTSLQFGQTYQTWEEMLKTDLAGALVREWQRYATTRKKYRPNNPLSMDDFRRYIAFWYSTDILS